VRHTTEPPSLRSFGLTVGSIFMVMGVWPAVVRGASVRLWALALAGLLVVPALVCPTRLRSVYRGWMWLGDTLGWINTRIVLGVIFYALFAPAGYIMRRRGKDPMQRQWDAEADTYRCVRQARPSSHMTHQF
jgi:hypothetical protein